MIRRELSYVADDTVGCMRRSLAAQPSAQILGWHICVGACRRPGGWGVGWGVVAELLRDPSGTALAAEFTDGRSDGMLHLSSAGIIRALQGRHEEGVGPPGANTRMLHH